MLPGINIDQWPVIVPKKKNLAASFVRRFRRSSSPLSHHVVNITKQKITCNRSSLKCPQSFKKTSYQEQTAKHGKDKGGCEHASCVLFISAMRPSPSFDLKRHLNRASWIPTAALNWETNEDYLHKPLFWETFFSRSFNPCPGHNTLHSPMQQTDNMLVALCSQNTFHLRNHSDDELGVVDAIKRYRPSIVPVVAMWIRRMAAWSDRCWHIECRIPKGLVRCSAVIEYTLYSHCLCPAR